MQTIPSIPSSVKVGLLTYDIEVSTKDLGEGDNELWGISDHTANRIGIHPEQTVDKSRWTLIHEIFHCCFEQSGAQLKSKEEERIIREISPLVLLALRENPEVAAYLLGESSNEKIQSSS